MNPSRPKVVILGGTGFVGTDLVHSLRQDHEVVLLRSRNFGASGYDVATGWMDAAALRGADAIINLAGSPIAVRWTAAAREKISTSRVRTTELLVHTLNREGIVPRVLVSMSGINRYAAHPEAELDENAPLDDATFLGGICRDWEAPLKRLPPQVRTVILRTGVVLGPGGAMTKLIPVFRLGLGGRLASGQQWMSWIALHDLTRLIRRCLAPQGPTGVVNAVHPLAVRNADFTAALARTLRRPAVFPVPAFGLKLIFGAMADETLLASRRIVPKVAQELGFNFTGGLHPLEDACRRALLKP